MEKAETTSNNQSLQGVSDTTSNAASSDRRVYHVPLKRTTSNLGRTLKDWRERAPTIPQQSGTHLHHAGLDTQQYHMPQQLQGFPNQGYASQPQLTQVTNFRGGWNRWFSELNQYRYEESNSGYHREASLASQQGRRAWIGNLDWDLRASDVALWLEGAGIIMKVVDMPVHMQPEDRRRPSYCFAEFNTAEETNAAITNLAGLTIRGRPVKIDLSRPKRDRWNQAAQAQPTPATTATPTAAPVPATPDSFKEAEAPNPSKDDVAKSSTSATKPQAQTEKPNAESTRLWVGGLPHMTNINELEDLVKELFHGFNIESLSGIFSGKKDPENDNTSFCFVDLANIVEAKTAIRILHNRETSWGIARVGFAAGGGVGNLKYRNNENLQPHPGRKQGSKRRD